MPMYPRRCVSCNHTFEDYVSASVAKRAKSMSTLLKCPQCDSPTEPQFESLDIKRGFRTFIGKQSMSLTEGCGPGGVTTFRQRMGGDLANCIQSDGRVMFDDSRQREQWDRRKEQLEAEDRQRLENEGKLKPKPSPMTTAQREEVLSTIYREANRLPE